MHLNASLTYRGCKKDDSSLDQNHVSSVAAAHETLPPPPRERPWPRAEGSPRGVQILLLSAVHAPKLLFVYFVFMLLNDCPRGKFHRIQVGRGNRSS